MQSNYITNYIKYNNEEQTIVNENINRHYIYQKDIEVVLSCENSNNEASSEIIYISKIINFPQCLKELDSINGFEYHKINFFLDVSVIIFDIYSDLRLKSFRDVGITFYSYEQEFLGLILLQIKTKDRDYFVPLFNNLYLDVTHIRFERIIPNYVPTFIKPFYLNYRLINYNFNYNQERITSNLCSFQIKFYPYNCPYRMTENSINYNQENYQEYQESNKESSQEYYQESNPKYLYNIIYENKDIIFLPICNVKFCSLCYEDNANSCNYCNTSIIPTLLKKEDSDNTYKCFCNTSLGFKEEPNLEYNICLCKDNYYYYNSIELCKPKEELENGPYYNKTTNYNNTIIFYDCYKSCKKCSKGKDTNSHNCKECANGYYPLKEEQYKESFDCFGNDTEIINKTNKTNYYFNDTEKYWDECYESCQKCDSFGTKNKQNCKLCKPGYHFYNYSNDPNNCNKYLNSYGNCISTDEDIYNYNNFCLFCKEGFTFVNNTDKCILEEELKNQSYYEDTIEIIKNYTTNETIEVKIYYPCHENCKSCKGKGDSHDNNCIECKKGYEFDINNENKTCIKSEKNYEDIWFKFGKEIFYIYKQNECYFIFYEKKIILISNKTICNSICPNWINNIKETSCELKEYPNFENMTREHFNNLLNEPYVYDEIKNDINIFNTTNRSEINFTYHITNFASESPNNLSSIDIDEFKQEIKSKCNNDIYNLFNDNIITLKLDIKNKTNTNSTQVEYRFYKQKNFFLEEIYFTPSNCSKRRLDDENGEKILKIKLDLPVDFTDEQISNFNELEKNGYDAFNSSSKLYIDNCNQFTTSKGNNIFLEERKKNIILI